MAVSLDGLFSFFASHHAIRAERVLSRSGFAVELIPGPKELSPNCGIALRFEYDRRDEATALLASKRVQIDEVHFYQPRIDGMSPRKAETATVKPEPKRKWKWLPQS
ncbi:MAG: DUF3343 domain-containing protein [Chloroflexi bacterium]|nr:MAG: hypothetical protein CUN54_00800 [Phototrophicales bacterium]RMF82714.1 MAG: DUF3343 domain-containing protein [Chloroflexota bacterium]